MTLTNLVAYCKACKRKEYVKDVFTLPPGWARQSFEGRDAVLCDDCKETG